MLNVRSFAPALAGALLICGVAMQASSFRENFSGVPTTRGWQVFGDTNLFLWDSTNQDLRVTWDSSQPNSFFYRPLGTILTKEDDFTLAFDLRLDNVGAGSDTNKASSFPLAVGLVDLSEATRTNFVRGTGSNSPDLVELAYFWDSGFGATTWPTFVDENSTFDFNSASDYAVLALARDDWYHIVMSYTASNQTMVTTLTNLQTSAGLVIRTPINPTNFIDFRVDTLAISSYSDAGQDPQFAGSVLAHGAVDNFVVTVPPPAIQNLTAALTNGQWRAQFLSQSNWLYTLERTTNFHAWTPVSPRRNGNAMNTFLEDTNLPAGKAFYRVRAERP
jgi:hypothetical protein